MRLLFILLFTPVLLWAQEKNYAVLSPTSDRITYIGRIDFSHPQKPTFSYPGVEISIVFKGSFIDVELEDLGSGGDEHTNYMRISVNDSIFVLKLKPGKHVYRLAQNLPSGWYNLRLIKRTESSVGTVVFHGAHIEKEKTVADVDIFPSTFKRVEFIGDSFTAGYGNEISVAAPPQGNPNTGFHSVNENNYSAWGAITCRNLKAEYMCTAYSGRGLMRNNNGSTFGTMPLIYDQIIPDDETTKWDHSQWHPDVIVIALGNNDFFTGVPDSSAFVQTYIHFVKYLRQLHPKASIVCVAGNGLTDFWPEGEFRWTHQQNYVQAVVSHLTTSGDTNVHYLKLDPQTAPYGEDWHPSNATHQKMADVTTAFIRTIKKW